MKFLLDQNVVNLKEITEDLEQGAVVSIMPERVRVRPLPIGRSDA